MDEINAYLLTKDGKQILPPTIIAQVRYLSAKLLSISTDISSLQGLIKQVSENGFNVVDADGNVGMKYDENGLDAALISSHFQELINILINVDLFGTAAISQYCSDNDGNTSNLSDKLCYDDENKVFVIAHQTNNTIDLIYSGVPALNKIYLDVSLNKTYRWNGTSMVAIGSDLGLGETAVTAYAGNKGKANADAISTLLTSLTTLTQNNIVDHKTYNDGIVSLQGSLRALSTIVSSIQSLITQVTENGFNVIDVDGNIAMRYDESGLDAALLSTHFQSLINALISTGITSEKGSTIVPLVNSLVPAVYLPSFVDDAVEINLFGTSDITEYCSANDGNTSILEDKFAYDDENKLFVIARQIGTSIDLIDAGVPEKGKIYTDTDTNKTYRWGGTTMVPIGSDMILGEDSATAYPGDKGKLNADNIAYLRSLITALTTIVTTLSTLVVQINEGGFNVIDANGNIGMKYSSDGLDVALLSSHFKSLIKSIEGIGGTASLSSILSAISSILCQTSENGYYVVDNNGNVGMKYDANGFDVALLSTHLRSLISNYFTSNSAFSLLSSNTSDGLLSIYHQKEVRLCLPNTAKIILYGDSISSTDYTFYKERMQYYTGLSDVNNNGLSGRTTAYLASNAALSNIMNYTPDLIIIQVGGNDVGDVVGTFGAVPSEINVTETDISVDYNGTYWIQAVSHIIRKVKAYYYDIVTRAALTGNETASEKIAKIAAVKKPHIVVLTPTPQKRSGGNLTWSYQPNWIRKRNAVVECCNKYNVQCIDIYCDWGVDMNLEPEWSSPTDQVNQHGIYTMDGLHPSQSGYERIVQLITGKINITIKQ